MNRITKKAIAFGVAVCIFVAMLPVTVSAQAAEDIQPAYKLNIVLPNEYSDGVNFGDGYMLLKNGKFNAITADTTFTIVDKYGSKNEISNTMGIEKVYEATSGCFYSLEMGTMLVGKDNKMALMGSDGILFGGNTNFYNAIVYMGGDMFFTTDTTSGEEFDYNTSTWDLRKKDGTIIKAFTGLQCCADTALIDGYMYMFYVEDGISKLAMADDSGSFTVIAEGYDSYYTYGNGYIIFNKGNEGNSALYREDGTKVYEFEPGTSASINWYTMYGLTEVSLYKGVDGNYEECETLIDSNGNFLIDLWKYEYIITYDEKNALVTGYDGSIYLVDYSGRVVVDVNQFIAGLGDVYSINMSGCIYRDHVLAITVKDTASKEEVYFLNDEGNKILEGVSGTLWDINGAYAIIYENSDVKFKIICIDGTLSKAGYSYLQLADIDESGGIAAIAENDIYEGKIIILKDGTTIEKYDTIGEFVYGHAIVKVTGSDQYGVIDVNGKEIVECGKYSDFELYQYYSSCLTAYKDGYAYIADKDGIFLNSGQTYKKIGSCATTFISGRINHISPNNMALTADEQGRIGLIQVVPNTNDKPILSGTEDITIQIGDSFDNMAGVSAIDVEDGDLTSVIQVIGSVDVTKVGQYSLTYSVMDSDMNAVSSTRIVTVKALDKVTGLNVSSKTYNSILLSWDKQKGITGYRIYKYDPSTGTYPCYKIIMGEDNNTGKVNMLNACTGYAFRVRSYKTVGSTTYYGEYSDLLSCTTNLPPISGLKAPSRTTTSINLTWTKQEYATGYRVYKYNGKTGVYELYKVVTGHDSNSLDVTGLSTAATYKFKVRSYQTASGCNYYGDYSSILTTSTNPGQVTGLASPSRTTTSLKLTWTKQDRVNGYRVYKYNSKTGAYELYKVLTGKDTNSLDITGLSTAATYMFKVRSYRAVGGTNYYGGYSSILTTSTSPAQVNGLTVSSRTATSLKLTWTKQDMVNGYRVYKYNSRTGTYELYKVLTGKDTNVADVTGLNPGTAYMFKVRSYRTVVGTNYYGDYSSILTASTSKN